MYTQMESFGIVGCRFQAKTSHRTHTHTHTHAHTHMHALTHAQARSGRGNSLAVPAAHPWSENPSMPCTRTRGRDHGLLLLLLLLLL